MFYDEYGVYNVQQVEMIFDGPNEYHMQKVDRYIDIDIYQRDDEWLCYVSLTDGNVDYVLMRKDINEFWDFDRFLEACVSNVQINFDHIHKNLEMLEKIYETVKEEI